MSGGENIYNFVPYLQKAVLIVCVGVSEETAFIIQFKWKFLNTAFLKSHSFTFLSLNVRIFIIKCWILVQLFSNATLFGVPSSIDLDSK